MEKRRVLLLPSWCDAASAGGAALLHHPAAAAAAAAAAASAAAAAASLRAFLRRPLPTRSGDTRWIAGGRDRRWGEAYAAGGGEGGGLRASRRKSRRLILPNGSRINVSHLPCAYLLKSYLKLLYLMLRAVPFTRIAIHVVLPCVYSTF